MPTSKIADELSMLLKIIGAYPNGVAIDSIVQKIQKPPLQLPLTRRTLQRRLVLLTSQGIINKINQGRNQRYILPQNTTESTSVIPVSVAAQQLQQAIRQPLHLRIPVGYQREFLDSYLPNTSFYLPIETRQFLLTKGRPYQYEQPIGTYARKLLHRLLIDLSWNSSRLEGNTYSLLETARLVEQGEVGNSKQAFETQMILNHKAAIEFLVAAAEDIGFNRYTILNLHALLSENLLSDPQACGRLRHIPVGIAQTVYHPLEIPQLIDECFQQILDKASLINDPFEQAFFCMVHLPYLQPFEDVNKRVSRLACNISLIRHNLCPLSFVDVPDRAYIDGILGVYEQNRIELLRDLFVWAYERSCARYSAVRTSLGEPDVFRLQHRALIADTIGRIVREKMSKASATAFIQQIAKQNILNTEIARFIEIIETEALSLHAGNIARYQLRPAEFEAWQQVW